jgi:fructokinase
MLNASCAARPSLQVVCTGALALDPADKALYLPWMTTQADVGRLVVVDANIRLAVMPEVEAYRQHVLQALALAGLVKVSDEDLAGLRLPGATAFDQAEGLLARVRAKALILTLGGEGAALLLPDGRQWFARDHGLIELADTIGAGDCFLAGFLAALIEHAHAFNTTPGAALQAIDEGAASALLSRGIASASCCVAERGCVPPRAAQVRARLPGIRVSRRGAATQADAA